jgi:hypothetical protein
MVTGVTPARMCCGGARRPMAFASYGGPRDATKWPGDALAHQGSSWRVDDDDFRRKRARFRRFRRGAAEGIDRLPPIQTSSPRFLPLWGPMRRGGALRQHGGSSGGFQRRRDISAGARVCRDLQKRARERKNWASRLIHGGGGRLYRKRGRRHASWRGQATGERHRGASPIGRWKTMPSPMGSTCQWHTESVCPTGLSGPVRWAAVTGLRPGKSSPLFFFLLSFFSFCFISWFQFIHLDSTLFAGFWFLATYEISLDTQ